MPKTQPGPLPARIDLIEWIKMRSRMSTRRAMAIILSGALRVDSHKIGVKQIKDRKVFERYVPADLRGRIEIVTPDELKH